MRFKLIGISVALFLTTKILAQDWPFERWHEGKVVLETRDTLSGLVKYNMEQGIVEFGLTNDKAIAYSTRKVLYFELYDSEARQYRKFYTLPYSVTNNYDVPTFFELLEEGKLTLLSREALEYVNYSSPYYIGTYSRLELVNTYFLLDMKGVITQFEADKKNVLGLMGNKVKEVEHYVRSNHLRYNNKHDLTRIFVFYNSLFDK